MVDGSSLPFEENVALTKAVVRTANVFGVDVEAELGHVGIGASEDDITNTDHYTRVIRQSILWSGLAAVLWLLLLEMHMVLM